MQYLQFENISQTYPDGTRVLSGFSLDVKDGEFLCIVGPSGCGKSTLLKIAAGLLYPEGGCVRLQNRDITGLPPNKRNIAMMFQDHPLFPHLNLYKNISFGLRLRGLPPDEIAARVSEAAHLLGLQDLLNRMPHEISGGQRQRAALARAVIRQPDYFLLDEPLSQIDASLREAMRREIKKIHGTLKKPFLYVTHDQSEALTMGDRIAVMNSGRIEQLGAPAEIYNSPATRFVAEFMGNPGMNIWRGIYQIINGAPVLQIGSTQIFLPRPLRDVREGEIIFLGQRPEDLLLEKSSTSLRSNGLRATIDSCETLGWQTNLYLNSPDLAFTVVTRNSADFKIGEEACITLNREKFHYFNESGMRIAAVD